MATAVSRIGFEVTAEELERFIHGIVEATQPLQVIAFGSRARGDHRMDSDLDLAVIVDGPEEQGRRSLWGLKESLNLPVDLLTISKERYDRFRPWINTIERQIDREGVRLYERGGQPAHRQTLEGLC